MTENAKSGGPKKSARMSAPKGGARRNVPTDVQRRWLQKGLEQPGGKLPLFDDAGREIPARTIRACLAAGWAEPWFSNPIKPDWLVCKLTDKGISVLSAKSK